MNQESIFTPFFCMMLLTILVWFYMYYLRLTYLLREKIDPQTLSTSRKAAGVIPDRLNAPSDNLMNLFELPILFYAVCIYLFVTEQVDVINLVLAYSYMILRVIHSVIHCTYNKVMQRFHVYVLSSMVLWVLIIRAFIELIV